jgi:hypothetical protein
LVKAGPKTGVQSRKIDPELTENAEYKNAAYVANECKIANAMKPGTQNHAKGGYHAALSNARIS